MKPQFLTPKEVNTTANNNQVVFVYGFYCYNSPDPQWEVGGCLKYKDEYTAVYGGECQDIDMEPYNNKKVYCKASYHKYDNQDRGYFKIHKIYNFKLSKNTSQKAYLKIRNKVSQGLKPYILIIKPKSDKTLADFYCGLGKADKQYVITTKDLSYLAGEDPSGFSEMNYTEYYQNKITKFSKLKKWDAICFISGGHYKNEQPYYGELENSSVMDTILRITHPTICAMGHSDEQREFDLMFDDSIGTPSLLGIKLRDIFLQTLMDKNENY